MLELISCLEGLALNLDIWAVTMVLFLSYVFRNSHFVLSQFLLNRPTLGGSDC